MKCIHMYKNTYTTCQMSVYVNVEVCTYIYLYYIYIYMTYQMSVYVYKNTWWTDAVCGLDM
jgi:hypothetical protein